MCGCNKGVLDLLILLQTSFWSLKLIFSIKFPKFTQDFWEVAIIGDLFISLLMIRMLQMNDFQYRRDIMWSLLGKKRGLKRFQFLTICDHHNHNPCAARLRLFPSSAMINCTSLMTSKLSAVTQRSLLKTNRSKKNEGDDDAKDGRKKGHRLNDTLQTRSWHLKHCQCFKETLMNI